MALSITEMARWPNTQRWTWNHVTFLENFADELAAQSAGCETATLVGRRRDFSIQ
jgi:hypothetical protein